MRISNNSIFRNLLFDLNKNREMVAELMSSLSSGKRVRKASDGAVEFTTSRLLETNFRKVEQYQENISSGLRQARTVQQGLDDILDRLMEFKKTAVQGATATLGASDRENLAERVEGILEDIVSTANARSGNVYVFGGTNTLNKPFFIDTTPPISPGGVGDFSNGTRLTVQISDSQVLDVSVTGNELRNTPGGDLFALLENVETALRTNDPDAVRAELDNIDEAFTHISGLATEIGSKITQMEYVFEHFENKKIDQKSEVSRLVDTDFAYAMSHINKTQIAYQAALTAHAKITETNLLDYLR